MRSFLLALALLSSGTVLAAEIAPSAIEDATLADHMKAGDYFLELGTASDLKAAILAYQNILASDPTGETPEGAQALVKTERAKDDLRRLAVATNQLADELYEREDWIGTENALCAVLAIDPFDDRARARLGIVRSHLRVEAVRANDHALRRRSFRLPGLGVPPAAERITNDARFSVFPTSHDRG